MRRTPEDLDHLAHLLERMERGTDTTAWVAMDTLFHLAVAQAAQNPVFRKVIEEIRDALARQSTFLNELGGRREQSNREHRAIVEALVDGSEQDAVEAMSHHLDRVETTLTDIVRPPRTDTPTEGRPEATASSPFRKTAYGPKHRPRTPAPELARQQPNRARRRPCRGYSKSLKSRHVNMIAIGGAIGTGLFLGAGGRLADAGPSLFVAYAVCGVFAFLVVWALGELVLYRPSSGAFVSYPAGHPAPCRRHHPRPVPDQRPRRCLPSRPAADAADPLLSSGPRAGLNEINLPPVQAGSSIMPGKVNPVIPEVVNQVAFEVIGNDVAITMAAEAGQLQLNAFEPIILHSLSESITHLRAACLKLAERCVEGITANTDVLRASVENSIGLVTALNPHIGYTAATAIAQEALTTGRGVAELVLEKGLLPADRLTALLSPERVAGAGAGADMPLPG